jgi:hypothetical protein
MAPFRSLSSVLVTHGNGPRTRETQPSLRLYNFVDSVSSSLQIIKMTFQFRASNELLQISPPSYIMLLYQRK